MNEIAQVIINKIENLRLKLLDLTKRNPLISTRFSGKSFNLIRVVDELPEVIFEKIKTDKMYIIPLPALEDEPKDENTFDFKKNLAKAKITDEIYKKELEYLKPNDDDFSTLLDFIERDLKDRVRKLLGMNPRQNKKSKNLKLHAENNDINPSFDLPTEANIHKDGRHTDSNIQTLLLPDMLESRLNKLIKKDKLIQEETGIRVLQCAFGFLEWNESGLSKAQYSPLLLTPIYIEKKTTNKGLEYSIRTDEEALQVNKVLAEKLEKEFGIMLPKYDEQGIESYFNKITKQKPRSLNWELKRWVAVGIFPSARLAMYEDLNPCNWDFETRNLIKTLFGVSKDIADRSFFGDEYNIDEPEFQEKVPFLITEADASQHSAIVDIADGKNLAIEGPPGTGKSQTIVNTIGLSLYQGKKVLFVAEKAAALEVVKSRLAALGLDEFILALQSNRSTKAQVITSIKTRREMKLDTNSAELENLIVKSQILKDSLKKYISILKTEFLQTGFTVHYILGKSIQFFETIKNLPEKINSLSISGVGEIDESKLMEILEICEKVEQAKYHKSKLGCDWFAVNKANIDPYTADELISMVKKIAATYKRLFKERQLLKKYDISIEISKENLREIEKVLSNNKEDISEEKFQVITNLNSIKDIELCKQFFSKLKQFNTNKSVLISYFNNPIDPYLIESIKSMHQIMKKNNFEVLDEIKLTSQKNQIEENLAQHIAVQDLFSQASKIMKDFKELDSVKLLETLAIINNSSEKVLCLRRKELDDPSIRVSLFEKFNQINELNEQKKELGKRVIIDSLIEAKTLTSYMNLFLEANFFSRIFNKKYKSAKKYFKSIYIGPKLKEDEIIKVFRELIAWKKGYENLDRDKVLSQNLSFDFKDLETDIVSIKGVFELYEKIDQTLKSIKYRDLKVFLKFADINEIKYLPKVDVLDQFSHAPAISWDELDVHINKLQEKFDQCSSGIEELIECSKLFKDNIVVSRDLIQDIINRLEKFEEQKKEIDNDIAIPQLLGPFFKGEDTNELECVSSINFARGLMGLEKNYRDLVLNCYMANDTTQFNSDVSQIIYVENLVENELESLAQKTNSQIKDWINKKSTEDCSKFFEKTAENKKALLAQSHFVAAKNKLEKFGLKFNCEVLLEEDIQDIKGTMEALIYRQMGKEIYIKYGEELAKYTGSELTDLQNQFKQIDKKIIELSRQKIRTMLYENANPPQGCSIGLKKDFSELSLIDNEITKKKRHIPVRELTRRSAKAMVELKPCWMMSPLAVSQYLSHQSIEFDLVIIDEASQMTPQDSIGALLRAKQAMVVGDTNQLPPSCFFNKVFEDEDVDEDVKTVEESILEIANSYFKPLRRLRWHYRSRNEKLIAFSNKYVYNDDLVVFPTAHVNNPEMGVKYVKVDGFYKNSINPQEASTMVEEIRKFMLENKDKSMGVVVLNRNQRDLLEEEFNLTLNDNLHMKNYLETWEMKCDGLQKFFIKNLENVQGDERDVIFIGTVYGAEAEGLPVMQRFGPINGMTGKRRLNVLFSRAKEKIVTFSSMNANDIRADENGNPGVYMLKKWLEYSGSGILEGGSTSYKEPDSPFEEHVISKIKSIGCEAIPQVGVKGFSIDIGVKHPDWPHGYIMGVECDGATYHSSRSARDRDRLRQEVLEGLGWYLYRIWSTDWFEDPHRETKKLEEAILKRLDKLRKNQA